MWGSVELLILLVSLLPASSSWIASANPYPLQGRNFRPSSPEESAQIHPRNHKFRFVDDTE